MKKLLTILTIALSFSAFSQTPVNLNIYHKLGTSAFAFNQPSQNNMPNGDFELTRMEYYLTKFSIIHDGGTVTAVPSSVVALVNAGTQTSIALGSFNVTNIEGVKFHVGVHTPVNHQDPALQGSGTPLAYQSPSMHWGWSSGYRFIALEGKTGTALNQTTELHGLGDANYFETTVMSSGVMTSGEYQINVNADYDRALEDIAISSGVLVHGEDQEAAEMIANFKNYVFSGSGNVTALNELIENNTSVYPIPSNGLITVETPSTFVGTSLTILTTDGKLVGQYELVNGTNSLDVNLEEKGLYFLSFYNNDEKLFSKKVINQ